MHTVVVKGAAIPALGLGTWPLTGETCRSVVRAALETGWRHIDTAARYDNERDVGAAIRAADVPRGEIFVTTKVWYDRLDPEDMLRSLEESLDRLGTDYVDLFLIHWPNPKVPLAEQVAGLVEARNRGWTRAIGVSNFPAALVEQAQDLAEGTLVANEVEYHPMLSQKRVLAACEAHDMALIAYAPIAKGTVRERPELQDIARRHGRTEVQVALRWLIQQDRVIAIPNTSKPERLKENAAIFDFELTEDEMATISAIGSPAGRRVRTSWAPEWDEE